MLRGSCARCSVAVGLKSALKRKLRLGPAGDRGSRRLSRSPFSEDSPVHATLRHPSALACWRPDLATDIVGYRDKGSSDVTREPAGPPPHHATLAPRLRVNLTLPAVLAPYYKVAGRSAEPRRSPKPGQREGRAPWEASAKPRELWIRLARAAEVAKNVNQ